LNKSNYKFPLISVPYNLTIIIDTLFNQEVSTIGAAGLLLLLEKTILWTSYPGTVPGAGGPPHNN